MNKLIPTLCLSIALLACAQEAKREQSAARTSGSEAKSGHARAERADDERVELKHRGDGERIASHDTIPSRGSDNEELTALDQGNGEADLELTQNIRKSVVADDTLSFGAKNIKIITSDGHVTLRGTVNSAAEKATIFKTAVSYAGVGFVTNQLEVDD